MAKEIRDDDANAVGNKLAINWNVVSPDEWKQGLAVELEHGTRYGTLTDVTGDDLLATGRIAMAHLIEYPDYYTRLADMEKAAEEAWKDKARPLPYVREFLREDGTAGSVVDVSFVLQVVLIVVLILGILYLFRRFVRGPDKLLAPKEGFLSSQSTQKNEVSAGDWISPGLY